MSAAVYPSPIRFEDHRPRRVDDERQPEYDGEPVRPEPQPERQEQRGTFRMIPDCVFDLGEPCAVQLYGTLLRMARANDSVIARQSEIAKLAKLSDRHVRRIIPILVEHGMLTVEDRRIDGLKMPARYILTAHLLGAETPYVSDRTKCPNDRTEPPKPADKMSTTPDKMSDHVKKHVNEKHVEKRSIPPIPPQKRSTRADEVACWYANRIGGSPPGPASRESQHAKTLAESGITDDELGQLFDWLLSQKWVKSISLRLLADKQNEWRSTRLALPTSAAVAHDPAAFTEHFNKLRRLRSRLFDAFEFETYVTAPDGEARYQADLVKYTALVEGGEGRA